MKKNIIYIFIFLSTVMPFLAEGQSVHRKLRQADQEYQKKDFKKAEETYGKVPDDPQALYNQGNSVYQQGRYADAVPLLDKASKKIQSPDRKADALHNLGNAHVRQQQFSEAVEAYEHSLRLRPGDAETKKNLQMAKKQMQEQQRKKNQDQQQKNQQNQQQQDQQQQNQPQNQPQDQNGQQPPPQGQPKNDPQQQQPEQGDSNSQPQQQPGRMSPEAARRLLESAIGPEDQRNTRKYREQQQQSKKAQVKDW